MKWFGLLSHGVILLSFSLFVSCAEPKQKDLPKKDVDQQSISSAADSLKSTDVDKIQVPGADQVEPSPSDNNLVKATDSKAQPSPAKDKTFFRSAGEMLHSVAPPPVKFVFGSANV